MHYSFGQRASAVRSVKRFKSVGYPQRAVRHQSVAADGGYFDQAKNVLACLIHCIGVE